jgi:hypothetical protein
LKQIILLKDLAAHSKCAPRSIIALQNVYKDTLEFSSTFAHAAISDSFTNASKFISTKFEFLDARHSTVVETISEIVSPLDITRTPDTEITLINVLKNQLNIGLLLQHGFYLTSNKYFHPTGCVRQNANIKEICHGAIDNAVMVAEHHYTKTPEVVVTESSSASSQICCIIPSVLTFIVFELVKNAISSVISKYENHQCKLPPIHVAISISTISVDVSVEDFGIGFMSDQTTGMFVFAGSRHRRNLIIHGQQQASYQPASAPLSGLGVGLCMAKLYATHLDGTLSLSSEGPGKGAREKFSLPKK